MRHIDVVTTATIRPDLLDLCYRSFYRKLLLQYESSRLIINIDPIGQSNKTIEDVIIVAKKYFREIIFRAPVRPNFADAVKWGWSNVESPFFLHLEDDWLLKRTVSVDDIMRIFEDVRVAEVSFSMSSRDQDVNRTVCLRPSFFRRDFITEILPLFDTGFDPEKQWKGRNLGDWHFRLFAQHSHMVADVGKKWRKLHHFGKWQAGELPTWHLHKQHSQLYEWVRALKYHAFMAWWRSRYC